MFSWLTNQESERYHQVTIVKSIQDTIVLLNKITESMEQMVQTVKKIQDDHKLYMATNNDVLEKINTRLDKIESKDSYNL